jgi:tetratricopeptide (TPR) repeat protein
MTEEAIVRHPLSPSSDPSSLYSYLAFASKRALSNPHLHAALGIFWLRHSQVNERHEAAAPHFAYALALLSSPSLAPSVTPELMARFRNLYAIALVHDLLYSLPGSHSSTHRHNTRHNPSHHFYGVQANAMMSSSASSSASTMASNSAVNAQSGMSDGFSSQQDHHDDVHDDHTHDMSDTTHSGSGAVGNGSGNGGPSGNGHNPFVKRSPAELEALAKEIIDEFVGCMQIDATQCDVWNNMGAVMAHCQQLKDSRTVFASIVESFPDYVDALHNHGFVDMLAYDAPQAIRRFQTVRIKEASHLDALSNYAGMMLLRQDLDSVALDRIVDLLRQACWSAPHNLALKNNLAVAQALAGQHDESLKTLTDSGLLQPADDKGDRLGYFDSVGRAASANAAWVAMKKKDNWGLAEKWIDQSNPQMSSLALVAKMDLLTRKANERQGEALHGEVLSVMQQATEAPGPRHIIWERVASVAFEEKEYSKADEYLSASLSFVKTHFPAWLNLGLSAQLRGHAARAASIYGHAEQVSPAKSAALLNNLATLHREEGRLDVAESNYRLSLALHDRGEVRSNLALVFIRRHQYSQAYRMLKDAVAMFPGCTSAMSNLRTLERLAAQRHLRL